MPILFSNKLLFAISVLFTFVMSAMTSSANAQNAPAFLVVQATITDREAFGAYTQALPPVYEKFGGSYVAVAPPHVIDLLEGEKHGSVVISKWESVERIKEFWDSEDYREVMKLREGTGEFTVIAVPGFPEEGIPGSGLSTAAEVDLTAHEGRQPTYMLVQGTIHEAGALDGYRDFIQPMLKQRNGYYIFMARPGDVTVLEGDWDTAKSVLVSKWPSADLAKDFWYSEAYQKEAIPMRVGKSSFDVVLIPGMPPVGD